MISVVVPVYNEKESLLQLQAELTAITAEAHLDVEVLFVDDGSRDGSWQVVAELARKFPLVHGIRLRRNFGKAAALSAGFRAAHGDIVMTLDADLQDDPKEIPHFLKALAGGLILGVAGFGNAVGPLLGGWLTDAASWRLVFFINVPITAFAMSSS